MRRTTIRLDDGLLEQAKREAQRRGETLTSLIEKGLRRELANRNGAPRRHVELPVGHCGPVAPGLDLNSNASIQAFLDEAVPLEKLR
jgi:hypothetical protein